MALFKAGLCSRSSYRPTPSPLFFYSRLRLLNTKNMPRLRLNNPTNGALSGRLRLLITKNIPRLQLHSPDIRCRCILNKTIVTLRVVECICLRESTLGKIRVLNYTIIYKKQEVGVSKTHIF